MPEREIKRIAIGDHLGDVFGSAVSPEALEAAQSQQLRRIAVALDQITNRSAHPARTTGEIPPDAITANEGDIREARRQAEILAAAAVVAAAMVAKMAEQLDLDPRTFKAARPPERPPPRQAQTLEHREPQPAAKPEVEPEQKHDIDVQPRPPEPPGSKEVEPEQQHDYDVMHQNDPKPPPGAPQRAAAPPRAPTQPTRQAEPPPARIAAKPDPPGGKAK